MGRMRKMNNKGFTLVEIMLSIAILALISVPLMKYFSDSLRYSAQTAEKQKATLLAQETVELIKAQKKIVKEVSVPSPSPGMTAPPKSYGVVSDLLAVFAGDPSASPYVSAPPNFSSTGATGTAADPQKLIFRYVDKRSKKYYVEASFLCTTDMASVSSPAIMSIDDTRNVVIAEHTEEQDAMTFFQTANLNNYLAFSGAVIEDPDVSPSASADPFEYIDITPGPTATPRVEPTILPDSVIKENTKRIIFVTISKHTGDAHYTVKANYQYFCEDAFGDGTGEMDRVSPDLVETTVDNLEGIFLMFNRFRPDTDDIQIWWDVEDTTITEYPDIRLIVQDDVAPSPTPLTLDPDADPVADPVLEPTPTSEPIPGTEYKLRVSLYKFDPTITMSVHSNLEAGKIQFFKVDVPVEKPEDVDGATERDDIDVLQLAGDGIPVRVFDVEVKVYKDKAAFDAGKDPLIVLNTTKVE